MSVRLFIEDKRTNSIHEYGESPHDSLILCDDGKVMYYNLQTGETSAEQSDYRFCCEDGTDPRERVDFYHAYLDIGGEKRIIDKPDTLSVLKKLLVKEKILSQISNAPTTDHIDAIAVLEPLIKELGGDVE